ncbi:MAG: hypothetical protein E7660_02545 [Ruminococcaceae bacterium]|nr:hypothetical protein [Oscillospiraceae bacterium]
MNKITKKLLAFFLCAVLLLAPVSAFAVEAGGLGSQENPHALSASAMRPLRFSVEPGDSVWVKADIEQATVTVGLATTPDYRISYNSYNYVPTSEDNTLVFGITDKSVPFQVTNTGTEAVSFAMALTAGTPEDRTGTRDYPETVVLEENPRTGMLGAFLSRELKNGNDGYHFIVNAPADGAISVSVSATDAEWNDLGWSFNASNRTTGIYGATHYSTDEPLVDVEHVKVSAGDEVIIMAATFDPEKPFTNPAGTVYVTLSFSEIGSVDYPETITEPGTFANEMKNGNQGHYYTWTAEAAGSVTVEMLDAEGWQYMINASHTDGRYIYGDTHWSDDDPAVPSETHEVEEGDVLTIFIATYDPEMWFSNPAGTVNWKLSFKEASSVISGDVDGDEKITTKDVLVLRKALGGVVSLTDAEILAGDCDGNGKITTADVLAIRKYLGGIITELPIAK